jgi:hypothetical protein
MVFDVQAESLLSVLGNEIFAANQCGDIVSIEPGVSFNAVQRIVLCLVNRITQCEIKIILQVPLKGDFHPVVFARSIVHTAGQAHNCPGCSALKTCCCP